MRRRHRPIICRPKGLDISAPPRPRVVFDSRCLASYAPPSLRTRRLPGRVFVSSLSLARYQKKRKQKDNEARTNYHTLLTRTHYLVLSLGCPPGTQQGYLGPSYLITHVWPPYILSDYLPYSAHRAMPLFLVPIFVIGAH